MQALSLRQHITRVFCFNRHHRILLYRRLSAFVDAGVPVKEALERVHSRYAERQDARASMLLYWLQHIKAGYTVAEALHAWSPPGECTLLEAAQKSGKLADGFSRAAWLSETAGRISSHFLNAISYPAIILLLLFLVMGWFTVSLIPTFAAAIPPDNWQGSARQLYQLSIFLTQHGPWLLICLIAASFTFVWSIPRWRGAWRNHLDHYPPYSFYRMYQGTVLLISLAAMTRARIPVYDALTIIQRQSALWLQDKVNRMRFLLQTGADPGEALNSPLFDFETLDDLNVYGSLGDLGNMLNAMSEHIVQSAMQKVSLISKTLNYVLLAIAGGQIAWMLSALYSLPDGLAA